MNLLPLANIVQWMGLPELASEHGAMIDHMLNAVHWFMMALFVFWTGFFFYVIFRFRSKKHPKADYHGMRSHFSTHLEFGVVIVEVVLLLGFAFPLWAKRVNAFPVDGRPIQVRATGYQFGWNFHYAGVDRQFGPRSKEMLSGLGDIGLDVREEEAKDDVTVPNLLRVPINRPVIVQLGSLDVIHNLGLLNMRVSQDAIPGQEIPLWFTPTKTGEYEIICGQLCGSGHYSMRAILEVMPAEEYDAWLTQASADAIPISATKLEVFNKKAAEAKPNEAHEAQNH